MTSLNSDNRVVPIYSMVSANKGKHRPHHAPDRKISSISVGEALKQMVDAKPKSATDAEMSVAYRPVVPTMPARTAGLKKHLGRYKHDREPYGFLYRFSPLLSLRVPLVAMLLPAGLPRPPFSCAKDSENRADGMPPYRRSYYDIGLNPVLGATGLR